MEMEISLVSSTTQQVKLIATGRDGTRHAVEGVVGRSLMESLRDGGLAEISAMCGGCCSCATCHVYVQPEFFDRLSPIGEDESDLLDGSGTRTEYSRLSCQVQITPELEGLNLEVAPD